jgi:hypothetical protein
MGFQLVVEIYEQKTMVFYTRPMEPRFRLTKEMRLIAAPAPQHCSISWILYLFPMGIRVKLLTVNILQYSTIKQNDSYVRKKNVWKIN